MQELSFHEATLLGISAGLSSACLHLEDVTDADGGKVCGVLSVDHVIAIESEHVRADTLEMEAPDGEVVYLNLEDGALDFVIEWNDFASRTKFQRHYRITGTQVRWDSDVPPPSVAVGFRVRG